MHYPLAMRPLALMDQRACKELEEPGTVQQDKNDQGGRGQRVGRWRWREREAEKGWGGWRRAGEGYEGHGSLSVASWTHLKGGR